MWGCIFKCICGENYDWLRLNGVNVFACCLSMFRMTNSRLEVRIFFVLNHVLLNSLLPMQSLFLFTLDEFTTHVTSSLVVYAVIVLSASWEYRFSKPCQKILKKLKSFCRKRDASDCTGIRARVFRLPVDCSN